MEREEDRRQREAHAVQVVEAQARKAQEREEAARAKALQRKEVARLKAERAALLAFERALKAAGRRVSRHPQVSTAAETTEVREIDSRLVRDGCSDDVRSPPVDMQELQGDFSFFNHQPAPYASSSNGQFVFNNAFN